MGYGVNTDYFSLNSADIVLQSGNLNPSYATEATSEDSNGDVACTTKAGETNEVSNAYKLVSGTSVAIDTAIGKLGEVVTFDASTHYQITGIDIATDNKDFPTVTVSGVQDPGTTAGTHAEYTTGLTVSGTKAAQAIGVANVTGNVISSTVSIAGNIVTVPDADGDIVKREPYGIKISASNTIQDCSSVPTAVADTGYTLDAPVGLAEVNTDYGTATVSVFKQIAQD